MYRNSIVILMLVIALSSISFAQEEHIGLSDKTKQAVARAMDHGVRFLRKQQNSGGHWGDPGITSLIMTAFFKCHRRYGPADGPWMRTPMEYLAKCQKDDGGIYLDQLANYNTCVAIMAFTTHPEVAQKYRNTIEKAKSFVIELQCDEEEGYTPQEDTFYGGIGYGSSERPDLSNTQYAIEALREAGVPPTDPVFKKAMVFLQRCQNRSESNDQEWAGNDGGFIYYPGSSAAGKEQLPNGKASYRSYGSMTYAGIKSYIYVDLKKDDPRFQSAYQWIQNHYDLTQNPGMGKEGLYYYYHTFGKTMVLLGEPVIVDANQVKHNWKEELATAILSQQLADGSWKNTSSRWWEADPRLVTAYAIITLSYCLE